MGEIIYAIVMSFFVPIVMIVCGYWMWKMPPKSINSLVGYRTARSMKNKDTWEFAHNYCGKLWCQWGWGMLAFTAVFLLIVMMRMTEVSYIVVMVGLMTLQTIVLCVAIYPVEKALARTFDKDGNRIEDTSKEA